MRLPSWLLCFTLAFAVKASDRIDLIEFFGYQGIDVEAVRKALPLHQGGNLDDKTRSAIRETVKRVAGGDATDIAPICCNEKGHSVLFIGLPGKSTHAFRLNAKPTGSVGLPAEFLALFDRMEKEVLAAIKVGGDAPMEDDSQGYMLTHYPAAKKLQLQFRDYTRAHEAEIYDALENCADNQQRSHAARAVGYARRSTRQMAALVRASRDSHADVRDESTRAIGVLLQADAALAAQVPAADFIEMAASGNWMDRNKASGVLDELTRSRDPKLLTQIQSQAWVPLLEMARWRDTSHAVAPRLVLGRVRGIPEGKLIKVVFETPEVFLNAMGAK